MMVRLRGWVGVRALMAWLIVASASGDGAAVHAEETPDDLLNHPRSCDAIHDDGKDGVCGHAVAAQAYFDAHGSLPPLMVAADAASDETDLTHCHLDIEVNPVAKTVAGSNKLDITSRVPGLNEISLDLRSNMTVDGVTVNGVAAAYDRPTNKVRITLDRTYGVGETFQVVVAYHGTPSNLNWGSFSFGTHSGISIVASLSEPWYANTWWPCKEAIHDKFTMDTWVTVPDWMIVASNGSLQGTDSLSGARKRFRWRESYPISVYLVSVAMTNYTKWTEYYVHPGGSMPVEFYIYPEQVATVQPQVANLVTMVQTLSQGNIYGEYPFINEKYGIAQFNWCCGMEHQTITSQGSFPETRNLHELAHSWWGNDVTCKTWRDIWLNEGFASYSEALWFEKQPGGTYQAYINRMLERKPSYFADTVYCYDISSVSRIFSQNYSYNKGAWVMHMLRYVLGDADFFGGLQAYRATYSGVAADTLEFQAAMESFSGKPLDWFFNQWVFGGGGPYYRRGWENVQADGRNWVRYYVNQYQRESQPSYPYFQMPLEITVTTASGSTTHTVWNFAEKQWYLLPTDQPATQVDFDPNIRILRANDQNVPYVSGPPKIVRTVPAPGEQVYPPATVSAVDLYFSEPIAYASTDFGVTGTLSGPRSFAVNYDAATYRIRLQFSQPLPSGDAYTVHVADTLASSAAGLALDGETTGNWVSGDGIPGGAAEFSFIVGNPLPPCPSPSVDANEDGDVDQEDFGVFQACMTGPDDPAGTFDFAACRCQDHDGDHDVDTADWAVFLACSSGPGILANPDCADGVVLLTEGFDDPSSAGRWAVFASSADYTAEFGFDYSTLGIPPAPNGSGTGGLRFTVNNNDQVAETAAVSAYPVGYSFAGNFTLAFDMWMNFPGSGAASGTTEMMNVGVNLPGNTVAWPSNPGEGVTVAVTGDGDGAPGTSADYHCYRGATMLLPAGGAYAAGTTSTAQDNTHSYYQALFPSPPSTVAGAPAGRWVRVELSQSNGTITWKMNGTSIASYAEATYTQGNIMLGYMDLWTSIANPSAEAFIIYDNVEVK